MKPLLTCKKEQLAQLVSEQLLRLCLFENIVERISLACNRPFSFSEKNQNRTKFLLHVVENSNVYHSEASSNTTQSNLAFKNVYK